jgi:hypothetical protein
VAQHRLPSTPMKPDPRPRIYQTKVSGTPSYQSASSSLHTDVRLRFLRGGLAALLVFTASKMLAGKWVHVSAGMSVAVIGAVLLATIAASVWQMSSSVPAQ